MMLLLAELPGPARASEQRYPYPGLDTSQKRLELAEKERGAQCPGDALKTLFNRGFHEAASGRSYLPALGMVVLPELEALGPPGQGREACSGLKDEERECCHRGFAAGQKQLLKLLRESKSPGLDGSICAAFVVSGVSRAKAFCEKQFPNSRPSKSGLGEAVSCRSLDEGEQKRVRGQVALSEWATLGKKAYHKLSDGISDLMSGRGAKQESQSFLAAAKSGLQALGSALERSFTDPSAYEHLCSKLAEPFFEQQITCYSAGFEQGLDSCKEALMEITMRSSVAVSATEVSNRKPPRMSDTDPRLEPARQSGIAGSARK